MAVKKSAKIRRLEREARKRVAGYIIAGFSLVGGLAWNDAIKSFIEIVFPRASSTIIAKFVYALVLTLFIVIASLVVTKILVREERKAEEDSPKK